MGFNQASSVRLVPTPAAAGGNKRRQRMMPVTRITVLLPAVLILAAGCATKNWVREALGQKEVAINQQVDQRLDQRDTKIGERITGVDGRVSGVDGRVSAEVQRVDGRLGTMDTSINQANATATSARD